MLIAQITDLHIRAGDDGAVNATRLGQIVDRILPFAPDVVLATGDLVDNGDVEAYRRVRSLLSPLPMPIFLGVGNHDRRDALLRIFPDTPFQDGFIHYAVDVGARRIIMLDTVQEGEHGGHFCEARAAWLADRLAEAPNRPTLIAMHHPPVETGIGWMDPGADGAWARRLDSVIAGHRQVQRIVTGHVHRSATAWFSGRPLIISSSTALPLALDLTPFDIDHVDGRAMIADGPPAFTLHRWTRDGIVTHFVDEGATVVHYDGAMQSVAAGIAAEAQAARAEEADPMGKEPFSVPDEADPAPDDGAMISTRPPVGHPDYEFPKEVHNLLVTAQTGHVALSEMADSKASILMGATFVVFTLTIGEIMEHKATASLMILGIFAFAATILSVLAVRPNMRKPPSTIKPGMNVLFFGAFAGIPEDQYVDHIVGILRSEEDTYRAMARDLHQNGSFLYRNKFRYLSLAYSVFLVGLIATFLAFLIELALK